MQNQPEENLDIQGDTLSLSALPESNQPSVSPEETYQATQYLLRRAIPPSLYYRLRTFSRRYPILFLPFSQWRWTRWRKKYCPDISGPEPAAPQPLMKDTEIVIEGFPRTANTFTHIAFKMAQDKLVKIGHHTHAVAQVLAAIQRNIPTIVLIRDPEEAVISYLIGDFDPHLSMAQSIREYIAFYKPLLSYRDRFVLAPFKEITTDYGATIRRVNEKFGTSFKEFEHTEENVKRCFELIDEGYQQSFGKLKEEVVSRPSDMRKSRKEELKKQFHSEELAKIRTLAYGVYEKLMENHG
jgi:hypothetical protein